MPTTAPAPMRSISRTDAPCPRYAHSSTITAPPSELAPANVTPLATSLSWVINTCGMATTCAPIRNGVVMTTPASKTVPGPRTLPSGTEAAGWTIVAHRSSGRLSRLTTPRRPSGTTCVRHARYYAASVNSPISSEPPSTGTPSRSAPCLLGSSSSAPIGFHSSGRRRTAASTSRASPPPPIAAVAVASCDVPFSWWRNHVGPLWLRLSTSGTRSRPEGYCSRRRYCNKRTSQTKVQYGADSGSWPRSKLGKV